MVDKKEKNERCHRPGDKNHVCNLLAKKIDCPECWEGNNRKEKGVCEDIRFVSKITRHGSILAKAIATFVDDKLMAGVKLSELVGRNEFVIEEYRRMGKCHPNKKHQKKNEKMDSVFCYNGWKVKR